MFNIVIPVILIVAALSFCVWRIVSSVAPSFEQDDIPVGFPLHAQQREAWLEWGETSNSVKLLADMLGLAAPGGAPTIWDYLRPGEKEGALSTLAFKGNCPIADSGEALFAFNISENDSLFRVRISFITKKPETAFSLVVAHVEHTLKRSDEKKHRTDERAIFLYGDTLVQVSCAGHEVCIVYMPTEPLLDLFASKKQERTNCFSVKFPEGIVSLHWGEPAPLVRKKAVMLGLHSIDTNDSLGAPFEYSYMGLYPGLTLPCLYAFTMEEGLAEVDLTFPPGESNFEVIKAEYEKSFGKCTEKTSGGHQFAYWIVNGSFVTIGSTPRCVFIRATPCQAAHERNHRQKMDFPLYSAHGSIWLHFGEKGRYVDSIARALHLRLPPEDVTLPPPLAIGVSGDLDYKSYVAPYSRTDLTTAIYHLGMKNGKLAQVQVLLEPERTNFDAIVKTFSDVLGQQHEISDSDFPNALWESGGAAICVSCLKHQINISYVSIEDFRGENKDQAE